LVWPLPNVVIQVDQSLLHLKMHCWPWSEILFAGYPAITNQSINQPIRGSSYYRIKQNKFLHDCIISLKREVWVNKISLSTAHFLSASTKPGLWAAIYIFSFFNNIILFCLTRLLTKHAVIYVCYLYRFCFCFWTCGSFIIILSVHLESTVCSTISIFSHRQTIYSLVFT
jgi:hypothetical protein